MIRWSRQPLSICQSNSQAKQCANFGNSCDLIGNLFSKFCLFNIWFFLVVHTCSNEYPESRSWPGAYGQVLQVIALPAVYGGMAYSSNLVHGMRKSVKAEALDQRVCTWFTLSHKQSAYHIPLHLPPVRRMPFIAPLQGMTRLYQFHVGATRENCIEWRWVEGIEAETRTGLRWNTSTCVSLALSSRIFQVQSYVDTPSILQLPPSQQESIAISRRGICLVCQVSCRGTKWIHHLQAYQASRTSRFQFDVIIQNDTTCADPITISHFRLSMPEDANRRLN